MIHKFLTETRDRIFFRKYEKKRLRLLRSTGKRRINLTDKLTKLDFGCHIYSLRRVNGLDQVEFGKRIGLSRESVSRIENGKRLPHPKTITKIADALATNEERLFERSKISYKNEFPVYDEEKAYEQIIDSFREARNLEEFVFQCVLTWKKIKTEEVNRYDLSYVDEEVKESRSEINLNVNLVNLSKIIIETFTPETVMNLIKEVLVGDYSVYLRGDSKAREVMIEAAAELERFAKLYPKKETSPKVSKKHPKGSNEIPVVEFNNLLK